jgi:hypothetical protein
MPEHIKSGSRKIRKVHNCQHCGEELKVGEIVEFMTASDGGCIYTLYFHPECAWACRECNPGEWCELKYECKRGKPELK